ncbi:MAG: glutamate-5-semialdehyde dehydrogenase [Alphaproteobacteria bacterium]|nr:MAG: glutamate-5-semialdehyde dehydrogenase [Alphaproteobacteria bacterium]
MTSFISMPDKKPANSVERDIRRVKDAAHILTGLDENKRKAVLMSLAQGLVARADDILAANAKDLEAMAKDDPRYDRLALNRERLAGIARDVEKVANLPSPLGTVLSEKTMPNGLAIRKISVPLGVVGVIYEARPNVTVDVFALCFKAGNACVLKGGKEAQHSNTILADAIRQALGSQNISPDIVYLMPPDREATKFLLEAVGVVDVCIPRGSQQLIDWVRQNAKVPVIETGAGIVHTYFDRSGDLEKGRNIVFNAKTRRVSVCNALDTLLIHKDRLGDLPALVAPLAGKDVEIFADDVSFSKLEKTYPNKLLHHAKPEDFGREFLSYKMSVKAVGSLDEALMHIRQHTSSHSEAIITEEKAAAERFMNSVDAAAVYLNTSTAFTDGGEFGMGAEIGISTQKLHARGPMGIDALTSYKWLVFGNGQTRS